MKRLLYLMNILLYKHTIKSIKDEDFFHMGQGFLH